MYNNIVTVESKDPEESDVDAIKAKWAAKFEEDNSITKAGGVEYHVGGKAKELGSRRSETQHAFKFWNVVQDNAGLWGTGCPLDNGRYVVFLYKINSAHIQSSDRVTTMRVLSYNPGSDTFYTDELATCKQGSGSYVDYSKGDKDTVSRWREFLYKAHPREKTQPPATAPITRTSKRSIRQREIYSPSTSSSSSSSTPQARTSTKQRANKKKRGAKKSLLPAPNFDSDTESDPEPPLRNYNYYFFVSFVVVL